MADIPDPYAPGNHGAYLYTYAKKVDLVPLPVSNITQCLNYAGLPRAIATAGAEEEEEFYYGNSLTNNGTYGTKTATETRASSTVSIASVRLLARNT